jgi:UDP-N-acetylmuramoylalanine--D-glutamate ligase
MLFFVKNYKDYFKGKKITMLGLGILGRGVGVAKFLAEAGAILTITDLKSAEALDPSLKQLKKYSAITYHLEGHDIADFQHCDMVIKSAGVPLDSAFIAEAEKNGIPVEMDASLFAKLSPATIVGVTGSKGKSTVTHLLYEIIQASGKQVYLGGNVRGLATLPLLKKAKEGDVVVLELDSWLLQGFGGAGLSPHIAVFTSFLPDHLNYYQGNMHRYFADKAEIFNHQKERDFLLCPRVVRDSLNVYGVQQPKSTIIVYGKNDFPKEWKTKLIGEHNIENAAGAIAAARLLHIPDAVIKRTVATFGGVPGRMELVATKKGVKYYNDTAATAVRAATLSLKALGGKENVILLAGGADKNAEYNELVEAMRGRVKHLILFRGTGTDKIISLLPSKIVPTVVGSMAEAFGEVAKYASRGDVVLLSPGAASFGVFKNEFDRGDQFVASVNKL